MADNKITNEEKKPSFFKKLITAIANFFKKLIAIIKKPFQKFAEANPYFKQTMSRINNKTDLYGNINYRVKDGDFKQMSYISIIGGYGVIYGSAQPDYVFSGTDIASFTETGKKVNASLGNQQIPADCCIIVFTDGKKAEADIYSEKLIDFKTKLNIS